MEAEFLNNLVHVFSMRKDAVVMCIVKSETSLELLMNTGDMVVQLGMLDVGRLEVVERHARFREEHEEEIRRAEGVAMSVFTEKSGRAN